jgi:hypothetical protein
MSEASLTFQFARFATVVVVAMTFLVIAGGG